MTRQVVFKKVAQPEILDKVDKTVVITVKQAEKTLPNPPRPEAEKTKTPTRLNKQLERRQTVNLPLVEKTIPRAVAPEPIINSVAPEKTMVADSPIVFAELPEVPRPEAVTVETVPSVASIHYEDLSMELFLEATAPAIDTVAPESEQDGIEPFEIATAVWEPLVELPSDAPPTLGQLLEIRSQPEGDPEEPSDPTIEVAVGEAPLSSEQTLELLAEQISLLEEDQAEAAHETLSAIIGLVAEFNEIAEGDKEQIAILAEKIEGLCVELLKKLNIKYDEESLKKLVASLMGEEPQSEAKAEEPVKNIWYEGMHEITAGRPANFTGGLVQLLKDGLPKHTKLGNIAIGAML